MKLAAIVLLLCVAVVVLVVVAVVFWSLGKPTRPSPPPKRTTHSAKKVMDAEVFVELYRSKKGSRR